MATHDYSIANQGFPAFRSDLNNALAAIVSNNSSATEPTTMFAHMIWVDTAANPSILKIRNADNDAWITVGALDQTGDTFILRPAAGSATVPAYSTTSDTNTGVYFPGADRVGITTGGTQRVEVDANGNVGIGVTPSAWGNTYKALQVGTTAVFGGNTTNNRNYSSSNVFWNGSSYRYITTSQATQLEQSDGAYYWLQAPSGTAGNAITFTQAMTLDASGNLLVGTTSVINSGAISIDAGSLRNGITMDIDNGAGGYTGIYINRTASDGAFLSFARAGSAVGSILADSGFITVGSSTVNLNFRNDGSNPRIIPRAGAGSASDGVIDLGDSGSQFADIYLVNNPIVSSDQNVKQDISELTEAETRVAISAKSLLRKYRLKDAFAEKGENARIHFGIIAQDLKAAFEAEGLDAGRYAMFIHSEWWETQTEVPAVEAQEAVYETQTDEEGNEVQVLVSEAVEGKDAYTRTDTYMTEAEAPEGAVRKERMGIRYNELLAFIIAAI